MCVCVCVRVCAVSLPRFPLASPPAFPLSHLLDLLHVASPSQEHKANRYHACPNPAARCNESDAFVLYHVSGGTHHPHARHLIIHWQRKVLVARFQFSSSSTHTHTQTHTNRHTDTDTHTHTHRHTQTHTQTHKHKHTHTDTHRHTQTLHTHTHTRSLAMPPLFGSGDEPCRNALCGCHLVRVQNHQRHGRAQPRRQALGFVEREHGSAQRTRACLCDDKIELCPCHNTKRSTMTCTSPILFLPHSHTCTPG